MCVKVRLESLSFSYRNSAPLLEDISASIIPETFGSARGFVTVIMGASGSGKSTLLRLLLGDMIPTSGRIVREPEDARVSYLAQDPVLFDHLSIRANALYFQRVNSTRRHFDPEVFEWAQQRLGLTSVLARDAPITTLSGGERQRIALLRAVSIRPTLLLLDEPCRGLDPAVRQEFLIGLRQLADRFALSVVYVTHHAYETRLLADHVLFLVGSSGHRTKVLEGPLVEFLKNPRYESVALTCSNTPLNRIAVSVSIRTLALFGKTYPFSLESGSTNFAGVGMHEGFMLFAPTTVRWNTDAGIACRLYSISGEYLIVSAESLNGHVNRDIQVLGLQNTAEKVRSFEVFGDVLIFALDGSLLCKGRVGEASRPFLS